MTETAQIQSRRADYAADLRKLHSGKRLAGTIGCLIGVLLMMTGRFVGAGSLDWMRYAGLAVVAASWMLFLFVMVSRARYVRANPFEPGN